ncbi:EspG family protein [Amycolatopsis marina]|uniref:EspG family protein n=1 Tax=Amycolatopsis marina TaxID=490629 RepID=A0A1I0V4V2_9PSEU|nr:ESX secretion-associated protein EspG [Amycolatopsis marina]SFA71364.1 EspG family protein [Amycolatopsis marina]
MADRFEFTLGSVELSIIGQALGVNVRQFPLRVRGTTTDPVRLVRLAKRVHQDLERRRLSSSGALHSSVRAAVELFGSHRVAVAITGTDGRGADITVLTLTDGRQALGITQSAGADEMTFALFSDDELVEVLTGVPPLLRGAQGPALTVEHRPDPSVSAMVARRRAEAEHDEDETDAFGNIELRGVVQAVSPVRQRARRDDIDELTGVLAGGRMGSGYIVVTSGGGGRGPIPPLTWLDTEQGRYLVRTSTDESGTVTAEYVPAGTAELADAVQDLLSVAY